MGLAAGEAVMWCRRQAAAWLLPFVLVGCLTGDSSEALTTFGKTGTQAPNVPPPTPPPARECTRQADCAGIAGTSCVRTAYDPQTRCFCGDNRSPVNGQCQATTKGLRHVCTDSVECGEGMNCVTPNITVTTSAPAGPQRAWTPPSSDKLCLCAEEDGYVEKDFYCNKSTVLISSLLPVLLASFFKYISDSAVC